MIAFIKELLSKKPPEQDAIVVQSVKDLFNRGYMLDNKQLFDDAIERIKKNSLTLNISLPDKELVFKQGELVD
jgi:hypothetical protein